MVKSLKCEKEMKKNVQYLLIFKVDLRRKMKLKLNVDRQNRELEKKKKVWSNFM